MIISKNRRQFLITAGNAGAAVIAAPYVLVPGKARGATTISFVSFGGTYGDFVKEHWIAPFTKETGINVVYVDGPDLAKVKAQVNSKNVEWDVFDAPGPAAFAGSKENLWEQVDTKIIDMARFVKTGAPDIAPGLMWSAGIAYDPKRSNPPAKTFQDLWDVKKFPGRRGLRTRASETLEVALVADGVEPSKLYPLDLDRAFKALDRIKPDVRKWFEQTPQGVTLIQTNEVDYTYTYANRVRTAQVAGVSVDLSLEQMVSGISYFTVPRGTPRKVEAFRFVEFITRPDKQLLAAEKLSMTPVTKGVSQMASPEARKWFVDVDNPKNIVINDEYWRDRFAEVDKRFKEWVLT